MEKSQEPTPKRLREAKLKGHRPLSKELVSSLMLLIFVLLLWFFSTKVQNLFTDFFRESFLQLHESDPMRALGKAFLPFITIVLSIFALLFIAHIVVYASTRGFLFVKKREKRSEEKFYFLYPFFLGLLKGGVLVIAFLYSLTYFSKHFERHLPTLFHLVFLSFLFTSLLFVLIACVDYIVQIFKWKKEMKMSFEEIKEERKESEGDQKTKQKFKDKKR